MTQEQDMQGDRSESSGPRSWERAQSWETSLSRESAWCLLVALLPDEGGGRNQPRPTGPGATALDKSNRTGIEASPLPTPTSPPPSRFLIGRASQEASGQGDVPGVGVLNHSLACGRVGWEPGDDSPDGQHHPPFSCSPYTQTLYTFVRRTLV